jgi:hypothetical protein
MVAQDIDRSDLPQGSPTVKLVFVQYRNAVYLARHTTPANQWMKPIYWWPNTG